MTEPMCDPPQKLIGIQIDICRKISKHKFPVLALCSPGLATLEKRLSQDRTITYAVQWCWFLAFPRKPTKPTYPAEWAGGPDPLANPPPIVTQMCQPLTRDADLSQPMLVVMTIRNSPQVQSAIAQRQTSRASRQRRRAVIEPKRRLHRMPPVSKS